MPGRLMAEHNVLPNKALKSGTGGQTVDAAQPEMTSVGQYPPIKQEALPRDAPNGVLLPNGLAPSNQSSIADLPPEIQHITEGYLPLSKLFNRVSQECFNGLNELISELAQEPYTPQVNGFPPRDGTGHSQPDNGAQKRLRWLQFANDQRESFIKLLVILQWSKKVDDVSKLVDISVWNGEQRRSYDGSHGYLANMRRDMANARTPAPDVESALEVLNIGGLCRLSDLDYVPLKPLSAQNLLKQMEDLNVVLQTRLNLHEDLPYHFQNYSIASGRVTFRVESEFEVDLIVADEDPASQFWFTDFRLLSSSNGNIPTTLLDMLAPRVDAALSTGGLAACYELLHEVVLTHRITLLRRQALAMSRGSWTEALHVEALHRSLVVQYWPRRPGKKNWIQIGIRSTEHDDRVSDECAKTAHVYVKWFCLGKEVPSRGFALDGHDQFDMESIVKQVLSWHISMLLSDIRNRFETSVASASELSLVQSEDEPAEFSLEVPLHGTKAGAVLVEFITGDFALQPVTESSSMYETRLNDKSNAVPDPFNILEQWRASEIRRSISWHGERAGLRVINAPEAIRNAFGPGTLTSVLFTTSCWSATDWCMAVSVSSHGRTWWVTRTTSKGSSMRILEKDKIPGAIESESENKSSASIPNDVERQAAATLCLKLACAQLKGLSVPHLVNANTSSSSKDKMRLNFDAVSLLANGPSKGPLLAKKTCTMTFEGFGDSQSSPAIVDCVFNGQLDLEAIKPSILPDLQAADLKIDHQGRFTLTVSTPLGSQESIKQFTSRSRFIQQLSILLSTLIRHKIPPERVDATSIRFRYSNHPRYSATVAFHSKQAPTLELHPHFHTHQPNTHVRLLGYMNSLLSISPHHQATTFDTVLRILALSQSLLTYLDTLETADKSGTRVRFLISALSDYRLIYLRVQLTLRICHIDRRGTSLWIIKPTTPLALVDPDNKVTRTWKQELNDHLRILFMQSGDGVIGLTSGVAVEPRAAGTILSRIDAIVLECEAHVPPPPKKSIAKRTATPAAASSTAETESKTLEKPLAQKGKPGKSEPGPSQESQKQQKQQQQQQQRPDEVINRSHAGSVASNASGNTAQSQKQQAAAPDVIELD